MNRSSTEGTAIVLSNQTNTAMTGSRDMSIGSDKEKKKLKIDELKLKFTKENSAKLFQEMSRS